MKKLVRPIIASCLIFFFYGCGSTSVETPPKQAENNAEWSGTMRSLHTTLAELEPYLFDTVRFEYPGNQEFIKEKIGRLAKESRNLQHNPTLAHRDPTVRFVASKFSKYLERAENQFNDGRKSFARSEIIKVTQFCVECHTRMQGGPEFKLGKIEEFLPQMPVMDRAEYLIASRKFDPAFELLVKKLANVKEGEPDPWKLERVAKVAMQIAIQYKQDPAMASRVVETITANAAIPFFLQEKARAWKRSIADWKLEPGKAMSMESLKKLVNDRTSDVEAMRAIPEITKRLSQGPKGEELGELLYLAGESYRTVNDISPIELSDDYQETCVREVPHSNIAVKCYKSLATSVKLGYTGTSGTHLPPAVVSELEELRLLAEPTAQPKKKK